MTEKMYYDPRNGMKGVLSDFEDMFREVLNDPVEDFVQEDFDVYVSEYLEDAD